MRVIRSLGLSLAACLVVSGALAGELLWIEPDPPLPKSEETVRLRPFEGRPEKGRAAGLRAENVASYQRLWNSGRSNLMRDLPEAGTARFRPTEPGLQLVTLEARAPSRTKSGERSTFYCKSFVVVGAAPSAGQLHFSEVGHRLEIVPQTDPIQFARGGGTVELQVLFDREPLAGARVFAARRGAEPGATAEARSDEIGLVRFRLDERGTWILYVEHRARCTDCGTAGEERLAGSLVLHSGGS